MSAALTVGVVYALGAAIGLLRLRERRVDAAAAVLLWPLGPLTFMVTVAFLLCVATVVWPLVGLVAVLLAIGGWWLLG